MVSGLEMNTLKTAKFKHRLWMLALRSLGTKSKATLKLGGVEVYQVSQCVCLQVALQHILMPLVDSLWLVPGDSPIPSVRRNDTTSLPASDAA